MTPIPERPARWTLSRAGIKIQRLVSVLIDVDEADRFKAGDSIEDLAGDFEVTPAAIQEAIRCELDRREAA